jgi:hypothetical protein
MRAPVPPSCLIAEWSVSREQQECQCWRQYRSTQHPLYRKQCPSNRLRTPLLSTYPMVYVADSLAQLLPHALLVCSWWVVCTCSCVRVVLPARRCVRCARAVCMCPKQSSGLPKYNTARLHGSGQRRPAKHRAGPYPQCILSRRHNTSRHGDPSGAYLRHRDARPCSHQVRRLFLRLHEQLRSAEAIVDIAAALRLHEYNPADKPCCSVHGSCRLQQSQHGAERNPHKLTAIRYYTSLAALCQAARTTITTNTECALLHPTLIPHHATPLATDSNRLFIGGVWTRTRTRVDAHPTALQQSTLGA